MKTRVNETIFSKGRWVIPMSSVQHIEKDFDVHGDVAQICIVTEKTKWSFEYDTWENACWITNAETAKEFLKAYCEYVSEKDGMCESEPYNMN